MDDGSSTPPPQLPPNLNDLQQPLLSQTVVRSEDGTIQPSDNLNLLQEVELMQRSSLGLELDRTPAEIQAELNVSKFPVTSISIGPTWRKESLREDDLTLKLYLTMKKLVWEFIEGPLKEKIEVSWSDITAIQTRAPDDDQPAGVLRIQLGKKPLFFRKSPPQPMMFTGWEPTSDFTVVGDALYHRIHEAEFAHRGVLHELRSALLLTDRRLLELSKNPRFPAYPNQQGESSTTAPCLPSQSLSLSSVNNPTPSQSQSHPIPFPVGVGESSLHMQMQMQGESSIYAKHQTPGLLMHMPSQQLPFSFTRVEQSLQGESAPYSTSTAPCLQQQIMISLTTVNNPTPSTPPASQSQSQSVLGRFPSMGESSRNANQYQTPLLMPSMSSQKLPFSFTGVEQSWVYNNPTPSMAAASPYLNPAMTVGVGVGERSFHMQGESSRNAGHHYQPLPEELYQYQNNLSRINNDVPDNADQPTTEMEY